MANPEHIARLIKGVETWNDWRRKEGAVFSLDLNEAKLAMAPLGGALFLGVMLRRADLREAGLSEADLTAADLREADLSGANLTGAHLGQVDLIGASLRGTDLRGADLSGAYLSDADLFRAHLGSANLSQAYFGGADLREARLWGTIFADTNLTHAKGLESCIHEGPSSLGIDTFFKSAGSIPESFLRGCGVPEQFITYARSLGGHATEFCSCFISYSSNDQAFAERLRADLLSNNLRCWFAPEDLKIGDRFQERIEESIRLFDKVMIVLSSASVQSPWVEREVNAAREREDREKRTVLFPIRIDDTIMNAPQPWAADIRRSRHIGDFRAWETHSSYQTAFKRLLRDLRSKRETTGAQ